ncbi:MAG TPA: DNA-binding transcriptional regulator, partial [Luteimonas sp.]|nr:DNA-binding transcriptional regulator [Luteimonas sp.]
MKQRPPTIDDQDAQAPLKALAHALACLEAPADALAFLRDLCTPAELEA